ncbi:type I restriction-modification system subunit M N-terminal domain-containing protein [Blastopirellula retiformator]|uniref:N6 adenine-specific DNA methyltransferase N-terminal domain-containing protein n=1 Tax=Blastopirellula retiformator TaxID=2527970 RepID=A0A5C5UVT3_9BACT|nr:type I restriction-modification system subunit M N-terminal domain-containing protein [Blastopirellula retiformator]TWT29959.1 hypothetical protein Enr8_46160 [Blastopirellula retiformator]
MAKKKAAAKKDSSAANIGFEAKLWLAADKLRNNMDAAEYKHVVLGLIFLKYISDAFAELHGKLIAGDPAESIAWAPSPLVRGNGTRNPIKTPNWRGVNFVPNILGPRLDLRSSTLQHRNDRGNISNSLNRPIFANEAILIGLRIKRDWGSDVVDQPPAVVVLLG